MPGEIMDLLWHPDIHVPERAVTVILGPPQILAGAMDHGHRTMQRYPFLYVCGNYSQVLPLLHRTTGGFSVRRGFTSDQLSTIVSECDATYLVIEHDTTLYEDDRRLIPVIVNKIQRYARTEGTAIVYSHRADPFMRQVIRSAQRVYLYADWTQVIRAHWMKQEQAGNGRGTGITRQVRFDAFR